MPVSWTIPLRKAGSRPPRATVGLEEVMVKRATTIERSPTRKAEDQKKRVALILMVQGQAIYGVVRQDGDCGVVASKCLIYLWEGESGDWRGR